MSLAIELKLMLKRYGLEWFGKYYGTYKGLVVDNDDPDGVNRLRINVPSIHGNNSPDTFAPPKGIYTGAGRGTIALPAIGDNVWVTFEGGDPRFPIWEYGFPITRIEGAGPTVDVFQTSGGHRIEVDNENNLIRLKVKGGQTIEVNEAGISLGSDGSSAEPAAKADTLIQQLELERTRIDVILSAIENGIPVAQDGGLAYQQTMVTILSAITSKADFSNVPSDIVTLD